MENGDCDPCDQLSNGRVWGSIRDEANACRTLYDYPSCPNLATRNCPFPSWALDSIKWRRASYQNAYAFIHCSLIFHCGHNATSHLKHLPLTYENLYCNLKLLSEINLSLFRYSVRVFYDINRKKTKMLLVPKVFLRGGSEKVQCQQTQTPGVR